MRIERRLGIRSAYGQLVLIVFLPIAILASVGAVLVFFETTRAIQSEQDVLAQSALIRYQPMVRPLLPTLSPEDYVLLRNRINDMGINGMTEVLSPGQPVNRTGRQYMTDKMYRIQSEQHVKRIAVLDERGVPIVSIGYNKDDPWGAFDVNANSVWRLPTSVGTAYGMPMMATVDGVQKRFWLFVDMDNEPLTIALYRIVLALAVTGLTTMLLLLLILNLYSKRWIAPIYETRLHLQKLSSDNLDTNLAIRSDGEFYILQKELNATFKRLNASFRELKAYSEETENDLQLALDEMEMQNISIRKARDLAVHASEAKSAFLANVSHELRTPLNAIDGFTNLLARSKSLDSKQTLYVQTIKKSSAHLLALINDVLDFSKIEAGKLVLEQHEFDLHEAVYEVADMLSPAAFDKGLRMSVLFFHDVPHKIVGDKLRVKQVLTNLIGNALKFTDTGSVNVKVCLGDGEKSIQIQVIDTGRGVDSDTQSVLFRSFEQGDASVTRRYGGTGLGLVISKQLSELMGGTIGFLDNNEANIDSHGSTFWFALPMGQYALPDDIVLPPLKVLSWVSHVASRAVLMASVAGTAVSIDEAKSLAQLLERLTSNHGYDWVIVDSFGQQGDVTALLRQVRLHYHGKLMLLGYEVGLDGAVLDKYGAYPLHEPIDRYKFYELLCGQTEQGETLSAWQGVRVLAVDDHLPNLLVLDALLGELGITVVQATSGFEAIDVMTHYYEHLGDDDKRIDLVFMDISMPVMSGIASASAIRKIESEHTKTEVPIIALSAHGMWDEMESLYKAGINDYATKPIAHHELVQLLQKWLPSQVLNQISKQMPSSPTAWTVESVDGSQGVLQETQAPDDETQVVQVLPILDHQDGLARAGNKEDLAKKLLDMLLETLPKDKQELQTAWQTDDLTVLSEITHRLLGASRYTGVPALRASLERFYELCLAMPDDKVRFECGYRTVLTAIDEVLQAGLSIGSVH